MLGAADPNLIVAGYGVAVLVLAAFWRFIVWVRNAPVRPDPWDAEVEHQLQEAPEACPHCSTPQSPTAWFCPQCGRAVGPYNNLMPYLQVFSEGEVLRNGTHDRLRKSPLIVIGYFLISFNFFVLAVSLARSSIPLSLVIVAGLLSFWFSLYKNYRRPDPDANRPPEAGF
jgi:fatty acid desaturase